MFLFYFKFRQRNHLKFDSNGFFFNFESLSQIQMGKKCVLSISIVIVSRDFKATKIYFMKCHNITVYYGSQYKKLVLFYPMFATKSILIISEIDINHIHAH